MIPPVTAGQCWLVVIAACRTIVLDPGPYSEHLEHPRGRPTEDNNRKDNDDEHSHAQRLCVVPFEASREGNADRTAKASPEEHHLVCVWELFTALATRVSLEEVDQLGEWEDSGIARKDDRNGCDRDKERFHVRCHFRLGWRRGEKRHAEIDKDKIFRQLRKGAEDIFGCTLRAMGHGVVRVMFERDTAEKKRYDSRHG